MMSTTDRRLIELVGFFLIVLTVGNFWRQQKTFETLETLESSAAATVEHEQSQENRIWDLHRQVKALEAEDERLLAHIKWFVMRRSGTDELRMMVAAVERLEAAD